MNRHNEWNALLAKAHEAGHEAAKSTNLTMMQVRDGSGRVYEPFPICGFAWVVVSPGTSAFARWLKKEHDWSKHWHRGIYKWVSDYNQSFDMKRAYATAYARVLKDAGHDAYADSRLD
jgi:hypothetical protein